jgi:phosphoribosylformylglycinamidine synthase
MLILSGEGIECEKESFRFFSSASFELEVSIAPVPKILSESFKAFEFLGAGDWLFIPGGFSFADHFGSGKLLAHQLRSKGFLRECLKRGVHLMGVCNGFQVLVETGLFGAGVKLCANESQRPGFVNRWVECEAAEFLSSREFFLPVRHGEGRLVRETPRWHEGVRPFLFYRDPSFDNGFDNGSVDRTAGLVARIEKSSVWGLMPHPEIAFRNFDSPDAVGSEFSGLENFPLAQTAGDGVELVKAIFNEVKRYA